jgi:hypothetical protein
MDIGQSRLRRVVLLLLTYWYLFEPDVLMNE